MLASCSSVQAVATEDREERIVQVHWADTAVPISNTPQGMIMYMYMYIYACKRGPYMYMHVEETHVYM